MECIICCGGGANWYTTVDGAMLVRLCKDCREKDYKDKTVLLSIVNDECNKCSLIGRCCNTKKGGI